MPENNKPPASHALNDVATSGPAVSVIYATFPSVEAALSLGREMVEEGLAGCVNVLPAMTSLYVWQGNVETANEAVMIVKLAAAGVPRAVAFIKARHAYETPAILVLPVTGGSAEYLDWLKAGTRVA